MAKVRHKRLRSQTIITSSGPLTLDENGHTQEISQEVADFLCDENKYGDIFTLVEDDASEEIEEEAVEAAEEEQTTEPSILKKKKVRRSKKKVIKRVRA